MSGNPKARYSCFQSHMWAQVSISSVFFFSCAISGQRNWEIFVFLDMMGMMPFKCKCLDSSYYWACLCLFISSKREAHTQIAVVNGCLLACSCVPFMSSKWETQTSLLHQRWSITQSTTDKKMYYSVSFEAFCAWLWISTFLLT
jgi:hypothetical protein